MESELSEFLGVKKCLLVNSGSSANLVAISTLTSYKLKEKKINQGDEVITVAAGFPTTVATVVGNPAATVITSSPWLIFFSFNL